jgi:predicted dehydrogenase
MLKAAIIGRTGAGDYGHGLDVVYRGMPELRVAAVADPNEAGRAACAVRTGAELQFADYREMLAKVRPEIVSVCPRWIDCHHRMVLDCVAAGVKGIFCEKPFARTLAEADEMVAAANKAGAFIAVAHQNRAVPYLEHVRALVRQGAIGQLRRVRGKGKDDARGGAQDLIVLGTHVLDMMRYIAGDPLWAWAHLRQDDRDLAAADVKEGAEGVGPLGGNNLTGYYAFPAGVAGSYESYVTRGETRHMGLWIEGAAGTISLHASFRKEA